MWSSLIASGSRRYSSHIVLYHSTFADIPLAIQKGLHNVHPEELRRQLEWYQRRFECVWVDEQFRAFRPGQVSFTFDDAYQSVLDFALPIFKDLNIPLTIFVNGASLLQRPLWRDKIRYLINQHQVPAFLDFVRYSEPVIYELVKENFYTSTKSTSVNSRLLDQQLDQFFEKVGVPLSCLRYCATYDSFRRIGECPQLMVGSHGYSHYLLSSLSEAEQVEEVLQNKEALAQIDFPKSDVFSIPFGGKRDFNTQTEAILAALGYPFILYSRNRLNFASRSEGFRERFMAPESLTDLRRTVSRLWLTAPLRAKR